MGDIATGHPDDLSYFRARLAEESRLAQSSSDPAIRKIHERMAKDYRAIIERLSHHGQMPELQIVREASSERNSCPANRAAAR